ncbi:MAG: TspO/MBR family protein [Actinomycetes bacterium]
MATWRYVASAVAVALVVAYAIGSGRWVTTGSAWYLSLQQPAWQPPPAVFGLAWSYNFIVLGVVGVAFALQAPPVRVTAYLFAFAMSISLAIGWAYLFYVPHSLVASAIALTLAALVTVIPVALAFAERAWMGWLLVPYLAWLAIATSLSWGYVALAP